MNKKVINFSILVLSTLIIGACGKSNIQNPNLNNPGIVNPLDPNNPNGISSPVTGLGSVVGRVVDASGIGLPNVHISIGNVRTTSNMTGDFQLNNVPAGSQTILFVYANRQLNIPVNVVADTSVTPEINPVQFSNNGTNGSGSANVQLKTFKVDQDFLNQWQAKNVAVSGGKIFVAVSDNKNIFKKGSIVKMSAESGKEWENIGDSWFGLKYNMDKTISGVAVNGSNLVSVDRNGSLHIIENMKTVKTKKTGGGIDVAVGAGMIFIANGSGVEKADNSGEGRTLIPNVSITAGITADSQGNIYGISNNVVKKFDSNGTNITDVITQGISGAIDLALDEKNSFIYVLEQREIKRFTTSGILTASFSNGAIKPTGIATDELGNVYVSDEGKDYKTSKIIKFAPGSTNTPLFQNDDMLRRDNNNSQYSDYNNDYNYSDYNNQW
jgi:hypothetical protein